MQFHQGERAALFIDGVHLYQCARALAFDIDYKRLLDSFTSRVKLTRALYYTALQEDQEYSPIRPLIDWLDYNGYAVVTKPLREFVDASGRRKLRGSMDVEMAVDILEMSDRLDHVVLFSGDADFRYLVAAVQRRGLRVTAVSTIRAPSPMISDDLRRQVDHFIELADLAGHVQRAMPRRDPAAAQDRQLESQQQ